MTSEIIRAAERTFHAAGAKPKDIAAIISKLKADHQVELSVEGGLLTAHQGGSHKSLKASESIGFSIRGPLLTSCCIVFNATRRPPSVQNPPV